MIEILIMLLVILAAKAKPKRRRRSMGRFHQGNIDEELGMTGLAADTLVSADFQDVVTDTTLVSSIVATYALRGWTPTQNAGPIAFGVAHSDYTDAEIEQYIESAGDWSEADMIAKEIAKRKIRQIGIIPGANLLVDTIVFNEGRPVKTKLNWMLQSGQTLNLWVYNTGSAAVAASTPALEVNGKANLWGQ